MEPVTIFQLCFKWQVWGLAMAHHRLSFSLSLCMPGVGLMVRVVGLGSLDPEFKFPLAVELIPGGVDSACYPSEVGNMSASLLISCVRVVIRPGLYPIAKDTAEAAPTLCTEHGPNGMEWNILFD